MRRSTAKKEARIHGGEGERKRTARLDGYWEKLGEGKAGQFLLLAHADGGRNMREMDYGERCSGRFCEQCDG